MNQKNSSQGSDKKNIYLLALLLFLASGFFLYLAFTSQQEVPENTLTASDQVNFNLQKTMQKQELERLRLQNEHFSKFNRLDPRSVRKKPEESSLRLEYDRTQDRVAEDLENRHAPRVLTKSVDDIVQTQLLNDYIAHEQNENARREYARQFIENARRNGYEIKLTSDFKVRSVRRIPMSGKIPQASPSRSGASQ